MTETTTTTRAPRYPGASVQPTLDSWQDAPHNRWAFTNVGDFVPTVPIPRERRDRDGLVALGSLEEHSPGLVRRLEETFTDALIVVREHRVVGEYYRPGVHPQDPHVLMSVSKSLCGLLIGTLVDDGLLDPDQLVSRYVPELSASAYGDATLRHVLDMTVAVAYDEDYRNPDSEVRAQDRVAGWRPARPGDPEDTHAFLSGLRPGGRHGERFQYCSADTDVLAWVAEAVTGCRYADLLAERLWQPMGCEDDASITVDRSGFAFANGGISCTARDLVRVGRVMMGDGAIDGVRVVSSEWVSATMAGGDPALASRLAIQQVHPGVSYRNQWWSTGNERGAVYAAGIHGQFIWLDPPSGTVVVKLSSCPDPVTTEWNRLHAGLFADLCREAR